ncbi:circularly permuted type 2 ATP-grasp protein [Micrococcales bacterium 31B]|nr:circularly permuted type 2 ATP-grasp protein [Micrococcales bacterium 31B]
MSATEIFGEYRPGVAFDEMIAHDQSVRTSYRHLHSTLSRLDNADLRQRADALARTYLAQGVTFDFAGEERPFPIDVVPRVVDAREWASIEVGVSQRVRALEAFLSDIYGPQRCIADGVIPRSLVTTSAHFHRAAVGIEPENGVRIHVSGIDLVRDDFGDWRVLEDNVRVPSGVSYVLSNRRAMAQTFPEVFAATRIRPVVEYPLRLRQALAKAAPSGVDEPTIVVLTPGMYNSAYFEHSLLARMMGVELVQGSDLFCSSGRVYMRTTKGPQRVDVIYRRVDDEFIDPVSFRADSMLGCAGLMNAVREGHVTLANAVGNGVADDKLTYTYVPDLIRYYLDEQPILRNVDTWRLEEPEALAEVLDRLDELVVKPVDGSGGKGIVIGPHASREELDALRVTLQNDPRGWIAQPVVQLSTIPTLIEDRLRPRHVDLRPFAVNDGDNVWVLPGGLTRVALPEGQLVVNSSQGGGSKDTWVIGAARPTAVQVSSSTGLIKVVEASNLSSDALTDQGEERPEAVGTPAAPANQPLERADGASEGPVLRAEQPPAAPELSEQQQQQQQQGRIGTKGASC